MRVPEDIQERVAAYLHKRMEEEERERFLAELEGSELMKFELRFQEQMKEDLEALEFKKSVRILSRRNPSGDIQPGEDRPLSRAEEDWADNYELLFELFFEPEIELPSVVNPLLNEILQRTEQWIQVHEYQAALEELLSTASVDHSKEEEELIHFLKGNFLLALEPPQAREALTHLQLIEDIEEAPYLETGKVFYSVAMAYLKLGDEAQAVSRLRKVIATVEKGVFRQSAEELLYHLDQE